MSLDKHVVQIGCGVVGGAYLEAYSQANVQVSGIEANRVIIEKFEKKGFRMYHISDNLDYLVKVDFIMISINTPLKGENLDLSYFYSSIPNVATILNNNRQAIVVLRSTIPPGTSAEYKRRLEEITKFETNIVFQPEFLRAKSALDDACNPWSVVLGTSNTYQVKKLIELYSIFINPENIQIMSVEEAELMKLFHNGYNACKISIFNQFNKLVEQINEKKNLNINIENITRSLPKTCEGLMNPYYGTKSGHAFYGICLPKDSAELASLEREYELTCNLFQTVVDVNKVFEKTDVVKFVDGDFQMDNKLLKKISSKSLVGGQKNSFPFSNNLLSESSQANSLIKSP